MPHYQETRPPPEIENISREPKNASWPRLRWPRTSRTSAARPAPNVRSALPLMMQSGDPSELVHPAFAAAEHHRSGPDANAAMDEAQAGRDSGQRACVWRWKVGRRVGVGRSERRPCHAEQTELPDAALGQDPGRPRASLPPRSRLPTSRIDLFPLGYRGADRSAEECPATGKQRNGDQKGTPRSHSAASQTASQLGESQGIGGASVGADPKTAIADRGIPAGEGAAVGEGGPNHRSRPQPPQVRAGRLSRASAGGHESDNECERGKFAFPPVTAA